MKTSSRKGMSLSVFFPCYNEEENVERTTLSAIRACERLVDDYEIIIVNDGSKDRTGAIADRLAAEHIHVRAVHNDPNLGYGGALQRGFREATKEWVFYTDSDGQFDFEELENLLPALEQFDIVSAYRLDRKDPLIRKLNAFCWGTLVNLAFGMKIRDVDCAFKVFRRHVIEAIPIESVGAFVNTEILIRARQKNFRIHQVPVTHRRRRFGRQSGANPSVILRALFELASLYRELRQPVAVGAVQRGES